MTDSNAQLADAFDLLPSFTISATFAAVRWLTAISKEQASSVLISTSRQIQHGRKRAEKAPGREKAAVIAVAKGFPSPFSPFIAPAQSLSKPSFFARSCQAVSRVCFCFFR
ncbi:MAG: hypothetical protein NWE94_09950 [Candidatus Bathyarchaeota archaeon]|nr:hypothetical protein [Candidatus Bathyarchaeota archaeon]